MLNCQVGPFTVLRGYRNLREGRIQSPYFEGFRDLHGRSDPYFSSTAINNRGSLLQFEIFWICCLKKCWHLLRLQVRTCIVGIIRLKFSQTMSKMLSHPGHRLQNLNPDFNIVCACIKREVRDVINRSFADGFSSESTLSLCLWSSLLCVPHPAKLIDQIFLISNY